MSFVLLAGTIFVLALHHQERISRRLAVLAVIFFFSLTGPVGFLVLRMIEKVFEVQI
jgi:hypothetical protein